MPHIDALHLLLKLMFIMPLQKILLLYYAIFSSSRGVARTQVMLMPRALKQKPQTQSKPSSTSNSQTSATESSSETKSETGTKSGGLSNSDFRNMLLKK